MHFDRNTTDVSRFKNTCTIRAREIEVNGPKITKMAPIGESRFGRAASENRVGRIHPDIASSRIRLEPSRGGEDMRAPSAKPRRYIREERGSLSLSSLTKACEIHTANPAINDKLIKRVFAINRQVKLFFWHARMNNLEKDGKGTK